MEDLTKHQLILLTLLVTFVTSIATGVITFTLLSQAPVEVTQTINRVVEKTIERVVPEEGGGNQTIKEVTTIVSEEDLVIESIEKNAKSIIRLKNVAGEVTGLGIVVSDTGIIAVDKRSYSIGNYTAIFYDGASYNISKSFEDSVNSIVFLKIGKAQGDKYRFYPGIFGNPVSLRLGQTLIAVDGKERNTVSIGRVSDIEKGETDQIIRIHTDIRSLKAQPGSPVVNLNGELVGLEMEVLGEAVTNSYMPIDLVQKNIKTAVVELSK